LDCERFHDECDYAVEHLLRDEEDFLNQYLDGEQHGFWEETYNNGQLRFNSCYVLGKLDGLYRQWCKVPLNREWQLKRESVYEDGRLKHETSYVNVK